MAFGDKSALQLDGGSAMVCCRCRAALFRTIYSADSIVSLDLNVFVLHIDGERSGHALSTDQADLLLRIEVTARGAPHVVEGVVVAQVEPSAVDQIGVGLDLIGHADGLNHGRRWDWNVRSGSREVLGRRKSEIHDLLINWKMGNLTHRPLSGGDSHESEDNQSSLHRVILLENSGRSSAFIVPFVV